MKITIITHAFPYPKRGDFHGTERYVENLGLYLKGIGNDVKVVTTFWNGGKRNDIYKGIPILRILDSKALFGERAYTFFSHYITFGLNLFRKKNFKFIKDSDIVILKTAIGFSRFFKKKKIPIISVFFHYEPIPILNYLEKQLFNKHKNIITISNSSKSDLIKYYKIEEKYIKVISIGVDVIKFNPSKRSKEIREKYGNNILLFSGLMVPRKRVPVLLEAMTYVIKKIPDAKLILTGKGRFLNYYKKLSKSLGIEKNTIFLGFVEDDELLQYYASSDIFVFPSEKEGFGQVLLEAMASGTPVICANKPPMPEIVGNGGRTFKLNDPKDLSQKIIELLNNRNELANLRKNALKIAKNYDWAHITEIYNNYIKKIRK